MTSQKDGNQSSGEFDIVSKGKTIQVIYNEKELVKLLKKKYKGKPAYNQSQLKNYHSKKKGRQYFSSAQCKAIIDGD